MHFLSYSMAGTVIVQFMEKRIDLSVTSLFRVLGIRLPCHVLSKRIQVYIYLKSKLFQFVDQNL